MPMAKASGLTDRWRQGYVIPHHHYIRGPIGPIFPFDSPNQDTLGAADEAHQHQKADDDIKQQQAQVPQPPVDTHSCGPGMDNGWANSLLG